MPAASLDMDQIEQGTNTRSHGGVEHGRYMPRTHRRRSSRVLRWHLRCLSTDLLLTCLGL